MGRVTVITDSTSDVPPALAHQLGLIVVPAHYRVGKREHVDYLTARAQTAHAWLNPKAQIAVAPPSAFALQELYAKLSTEGRSIVSLHAPARWGGGYEAALIAKTALSGRSQIQVINGELLSLGIGFVALAAAEAARDGASMSEVAEIVREALLHAHLVFFVDEPSGLPNSALLREPKLRPALVSGDKPLFSMEEGEVRIIDGVRSRGEVVETLYEFVEMFPHIERIAILYGANPTLANSLLRRIEPLVPRDRVLLTQYGPALAAQLGPNATGIAVYEGIGEVAALPQEAALTSTD